ncbi:hypothetical protein FH041_07255 [Pseudomonas sp. SWI7]|uniref:hypothetical protein n=1 Tax=Pseudomonas sp. SWI7 TaxID=2587597 RepID=UPI00112301F4|nr:hypothetical protein [Pseudomonas sp. SWI7]QDC04736.1 hypothetical protein FH041_07255 [Pseudomonas sp. SWI7]
MNKQLGLAKRCGFALLAAAVLGLPIGLFAEGITVETYIAVSTAWLLVAAMLILGESVSEVTVWQATIKRDVQAAKDARNEAEAVRDELRIALKALIESSEIAFSVTRIVECPDEVLDRRQAAIERLQEFAESDPVKLLAWRRDLARMLNR